MLEEDTLKLKRTLYFSLMPLIALVAAAQAPCGPSIIPKATLFVNWPQLQYDVAHTGCNPYESALSPSTVGSLNLKWQIQIASGGYSTVVVANGVLYTSVNGRSTGSLLALNASTNATIWTIAGQNQSAFTSPAVAQGVVYAGSTDHNVYALDAKTGTVIWSYATGDIVYSTPTVANGIVYIGSNDNKVYALNASTGVLIWKYATGNRVLYFPAVGNGIVYVSSNDSKVYALDANTGALIWSYPTGSFFFSVSVANGKVYVGSDQVYALDAKTGALIWSYPASGTFSPAVARGVVYGTSRDGNVYALNAGTGALVWKYQFNDSTDNSTSAAVANGVVYASTDHNLYALDASTGALLWDDTLLDDSSGWPVVANGVVYMATSACGFGCGTTGSLTAFSLHGQ